MKLTLELELEATDLALDHARVAGALVDYAAAVIANNRAMMKWKAKNQEVKPLYLGDPPVGFSLIVQEDPGGVLVTAQGVTIRESKVKQ